MVDQQSLCTLEWASDLIFRSFRYNGVCTLGLGLHGQGVVWLEDGLRLFLHIET